MYFIGDMFTINDSASAFENATRCRINWWIRSIAMKVIFTPFDAKLPLADIVTTLSTFATKMSCL